MKFIPNKITFLKITIRKLLQQSLYAYCSSEVDFHENDCIARSINGEAISE